MLIKDFNKDMIAEVVKLWNEVIKKEAYIKPHTINSFTKTYLNNKAFKYEHSKVIIIGNKIVGFANATKIGSNGFITCVLVSEKHQRQGYGTNLLNTLEKVLKKEGTKLIRQLFLNPINNRWYIPNTAGHDHPGCPAVLVNSSFYLFLRANKYEIEPIFQDAYYQEISNYQLPDDLIDIKDTNIKNGYHVTYYNKDKHYGFSELFDSLDNKGWHQVVINNLSKESPLKMLVVVKNNEILGWTGPLMTEESGRGYFAGIGIHPKARRRGLGKLLFAELIKASSDNGATFMSLFTGSNNPARKIYSSAGFKIVNSFAILRKEI